MDSKSGCLLDAAVKPAAPKAVEPRSWRRLIVIGIILTPARWPLPARSSRITNREHDLPPVAAVDRLRRACADAAASILANHDRRAVYARMLSSTDHEWPELSVLVAGWKGAGLFDEGFDLAVEAGRDYRA